MKTKILIIDDDEMTLLIHRELLKGSEFSFGAKYFNAAKPALKFIEKNISYELSFLILLDLGMPGMDGWQLLDQLQLSPYRNNIYVVLVTASENEEDKKRAASYKEVHGFVTKPFVIEHFKMLKGIKKVIDSF